MAISFHDPSPCGFNLRRLNQLSGGFICESIVSVPREAICASAHRRRPNNRPVVPPDSTREPVCLRVSCETRFPCSLRKP